MDLVIHRLILSISEPNGSPEYKETFDSVSTLHRRIAVQHPFAFVRLVFTFIKTWKLLGYPSQFLRTPWVSTLNILGILWVLFL